MDPTKLGYREVFGLSNFQHITSSLSGQPIPKAVVIAILGVSDWFFHPNEEMVSIVLVLILFDTITGFLKAYKADTVSSSGFFRFSTKLMVYFILMAVGALLDKLTAVSDYVSALCIMTGFLAVTESLSVLENISGLGYSVPTRIVSMLRLTKQQFEGPPSPPKERNT
jgi:toxin secretion/phage lysis holin